MDKESNATFAKWLLNRLTSDYIVLPKKES